MNANIDQIALNTATDIMKLYVEPIPGVQLKAKIQEAVSKAILAASGGVPAPAKAVHQYRKPHCSDWYDGHPDELDGGGPYETRTLYAAPAPALPVVPQQPITDPDAKGYRPSFCDGGGPLSNCCELGCAASRELAEMALSAAPELPEGNQQPQTMADRVSALHAEPAGQHDANFAALRLVQELSRISMGLSADLVKILEYTFGGVAYLDRAQVMDCIMYWRNEWDATAEACNELTSRCRAQGGNTSDSAPDASTESISPGVSQLIRAFNSGYKSGHHDTVEGQYTDIAQRDMLTYNADVVADMIADGTFTATQAAQLTEQETFAKAEEICAALLHSGAEFQPTVHGCIAAIRAHSLAILANQSQKG